MAATVTLSSPPPPVITNTGQSNLEKIENFINESTYKEILESSANFNTRLCIERRMRLPFIDTQTGVAQNHCSLFVNKRQRLPGLLPGQIYSYPRQRWRKKRRQYLTMNARAYARHAEFMDGGDGGTDVHSISQIENPALQDTDSKDSQLLAGDVSKEWFYDEQDMLEMENFDEPDPDSDLDYEESYTKRRKGRRGTGRGRAGTDSPSTPGRKRGAGRGRGKKAVSIGGHNYEPTPGDPDKPFACERTPGRRGRQPGTPGALGPPSGQPATPGGPATAAGQNQAPPTLPPNLPAQPPTNTGEDPPMPVLKPEKDLDTPSTSIAATTQELAGSSSSSGLPPVATPVMGGERKVPPSPYCDFCLGDSTQNKKTGGVEELVSCHDCGRSGHPTCLQFTDNMKISVKKYRWQCIECKCCSMCGTSDNDDQLLFCDDCDRGYHMYCLAPPLENPPEGSWSCKLCIELFHTQ